jgi:hypothetical protein
VSDVGGEKYKIKCTRLTLIFIEIRDKDNDLVARIEKVLYVKKKGI